MDKTDIPHGERIDVEQTTLNLPELPDPWEWDMANKNSFGKVNLYFGYDVNTVGGQMGDIDNFVKDDTEIWALHVRPILSSPTEDVDTSPQETAESADSFDTLEKAIEATPAHIEEHYQ